MVVRLVGNQDDYQKMLKDVEQQTEKSAKWAEEQGSKISKAFTSAFRAAQGALSGAGSGLSGLGQTMRQPAQQQKETLGKAALDFSEYGKSIKDMVRESEKAGKEAEELMKRTVKGTEAYRELEKVIKLNTKEMQVFKLLSERTGISVGELSKTIKVGSEEYEKWRKETEKFGMMFDDESLKKADELAESWHRVRTAIQGMWHQIGSIVSDRFKELNQRIEGIVTWVIKWIKENKELIAHSVNVTAKIGAVGIAVSALGTALSTVAALLGPITAAVAAGVAAWTLWNSEATKALDTDLLSQYAENFRGLYDQVVGYGKQIIDYVSKVMDGVFNAIKAGKLELAVEIAWSGVKVFWMRSLQELNDLTSERFGAIFNNLATGDWLAALEALWIEIQLIWNSGLQQMGSGWSQIESLADQAWTSIRVGWTGLLNHIKIGLGQVIGMLHEFVASISQDRPILAQALGLEGITDALHELRHSEALDIDLGGDKLQQDLEVREKIRRNVEVVIEEVRGEDVSPEDAIARLQEARSKGLAALERFPEEATGYGELKGAVERFEREIELIEKRVALEERQAELKAQGNEEAANALNTAKEELQAKLQQAEAEKNLTDAQRARARDLQAQHDAELEFQQKRTRIEQDRQGIVERWDPVEKYRRELKQLNALYTEAERGSKVYQRELRDIQDQMAAGIFALEAQFGNIGFDAVEAGTRSHQQLIQSGLEQMQIEKARQMGVGEAGSRDAKAEEDAKNKERDNEMIKHGQSLVSIATYCGKLVEAADRDKDKPKIHLAPLPEFM